MRLLHHSQVGLGKTALTKQLFHDLVLPVYNLQDFVALILRLTCFLHLYIHSADGSICHSTSHNIIVIIRII